MNLGQILHRARHVTVAAIAGVALVVVLAPSANAQTPDPQPQDSPDGARMDPRKMIDLRMAKLTETLKLDSAQQTSVRRALAEETMAMEELRKNGGGQRGGGGGEGGGGGRRGGRGGGRRGGGGGGAPPDSASGGSEGGGASPQVRAIRDSTNKEIEAVLNPQQLTTFRQMFEQPQKQTLQTSKTTAGYAGVINSASPWRISYAQQGG
jgi:hypothetical protein